jgi:hypothetical protein
VVCQAGPSPTTVAITAPGWTFAKLDALASSGASGFTGTTFGAIAPNTTPTTLTVSWDVVCDMTVLGDEFARTDPSGGAITFDNHTLMAGNSNACATMVTTQHANDAVWAACTLGAQVNAPPAGFTTGADDGAGDATAYRITTDPANTVEPAVFTVNTGAVPFLTSLVTLKAAAP